VKVEDIWGRRARLPGNPSKNWRPGGPSFSGLGGGTVDEEISEAYKDVEQVVEVTQGVGISKNVAKLRPLGVIKG
jgi:RNA-splicing ligase RtcB